MGVVSKNFPPFQRHTKIVEVEMDDAAIYRREAEIGLLPLYNGPRISGVTYPHCLQPYTGFGLPSGKSQQQQHLFLKSEIITSVYV